ncbi:MAG: type II toxin-antitoxin system PemK/MazF family toxin [Steroidobacteraceae bacterium]
MPLQFQPKPRSIVVCDFSGFIEPEIIKRRPVVILAVHKRNSKLVTVVPLSTTAPDQIEAHHYRLRQNPIPGEQATEVWAKCDMLAVVSIERLDLVRTARGPDGKRQYLRLQIGQDQFDAIRRGVASALGLISLFVPPAP